MQKPNVESHENDLNPENFPKHTTTVHDSSGTNSTSVSTARTQNFSFSSDYKNNRFGSNVSTSIFNFNAIPSSFAVLNKDDLSALTGKPNAIVRPIQRHEQPTGPRRQAPRHDEADKPDSQASEHVTAASSPQKAHSFSEELNRKLSYLHQLTRSNEAWIQSTHSSRNGSYHDVLNSRPLFYTTVPTGVFLPPPRESPMPWFLKPRIYAYSSHPVILNATSSHTSYSPPHKSSVFPKDKSAQSVGGGGGGGGDGSGFVGNAPIATADKEYVANGTQHRRVNDNQNHSQSLAGGIHITKQQFHQQIKQNRRKREVPPPEPYKNVMHERRVIRGSNFGATQILADSDPFDRAAEIRRRHALRKTAQCARNQRNVLGTPPPVTGRRHEVIQTEKYLEELIERPPEFTVDTQTDLFLERPPTPPYIPAKTGIDVATEIGEGELFHFDAEAQPIIDILVDACIEQSMLEVAHEQEIEALRKKQEEFLAQREAELAELRRLEAEEIRLQAEKERRLRQDTLAKELDEEMQKGVTAAKLLQGHIASLLPEVLENIEPASDATKKEQLMKTICPWLTKEVSEEVGQIVDSREILTVIIQEIIKQRAEVYAGYVDEIPEDKTKHGMFVAEGEGEDECGLDRDTECDMATSTTSDECPQ